MLDRDLAVTVEYGWGPNAQLEELVDPNGQLWTQSYDDSGRLQSTTDPLLRMTSYAYDERDRVVEVAHPNGDLEQLECDAYGRIEARRYSAEDRPAETFNFTYDALGRIASVQDETFAYDDNGVLTAAHGVSFTSDGAGRLLTVTLAPGRVVSYAYERGRLAAVEDWLEGATTFGYDEHGRLQQVTRPNGVRTT